MSFGVKSYAVLALRDVALQYNFYDALLRGADNDALALKIPTVHSAR
jgi:hypothetical protein